MAKEKKTREDLYAQVIEGIFKKNYVAGTRTVDFQREELTEMALSLGLSAAKNLGDIPYSFRQGFLMKVARGGRSPTFVVTTKQNHDYDSLPS